MERKKIYGMILLAIVSPILGYLLLALFAGTMYMLNHVDQIARLFSDFILNIILIAICFIVYIMPGILLIMKQNEL